MEPTKPSPYILSSFIIIVNQGTDMNVPSDPQDEMNKIMFSKL